MGHYTRFLQKMQGFFDEQCPGGIGLEERCTKEPFADVCESCWKAAVECEVAKPTIVLKAIPTTCNDCPCFGHESGICQITGQEYDGNGRLDECPIV